MSRVMHSAALVRRVLLAALAFGIALATSGCLSLPRAAQPTVAPLRISELVEVGDAQRRASLRLVVEGLEADATGNRDRARGRYDAALKLDPTNPYAYLAVARMRAEGGAPRSALSFVARAEALLRAEGALSPRVEPHLSGLRAAGLFDGGDEIGAAEALARARALAPDVWRDAHLSAEELR